ncbi:MAG: ABC-type transport auxiliary lipoprotein family protein [Marinobacter sp.]|nr:ABC-type transport auxiliary lipoprotein family protein [Marinobacter sp.]
MSVGRFVVACALATLLSACGSSPVAPPPGYLLPSSATVGNATVDVQVRVAGYLEQGGIVLQLSDTELRSARQHRWAEPLAKQLQRALHAGLGGVDGGDDARLVVQLSRFHGVQNPVGDRAVIYGVWQYSTAEGVVKQGNMDGQAPIATDGYAALVEALDLGVQDIGSRIASSLREAVP